MHLVIKRVIVAYHPNWESTSSGGTNVSGAHWVYRNVEAIFNDAAVSQHQPHITRGTPTASPAPRAGSPGSYRASSIPSATSVSH